jgi:hypothetical protein
MDGHIHAAFTASDGALSVTAAFLAGQALRGLVRICTNDAAPTATIAARRSSLTIVRRDRTSNSGDDDSAKVIGVGLPRTATTTQKLALEMVGLGPCYHMRDLTENLEEHRPLWDEARGGIVEDRRGLERDDRQRPHPTTRSPAGRP